MRFSDWSSAVCSSDLDLIGRSITGNAAHGLQADRGDGIAGLLVRGDIMPDPDREIWIAEVDVITQVSIIAGVTKLAADTVKFGRGRIEAQRDRKSTRLNSSH